MSENDNEKSKRNYIKATGTGGRRYRNKCNDGRVR